MVQELRSIASSDADDRCKVFTLGLLAELGERGSARFADPEAVARNSAAAFAAQLDSPAEIAVAADMIMRQLSDAAMLSLLLSLRQTAPERANRLAAELCGRHDVHAQLREHITQIAPPSAATAAVDPRPSQPIRCVVLERSHISEPAPAGGARWIVVSSRKLPGRRQWRLWGVFICAAGTIDDCVYEAASPDPDAAHWIARLTAGGYVAIHTRMEDVQRLVAQAARTARGVGRGAASGGANLPSSYYLGRDLLDLGNAHASPDASPCAFNPLGLAVERIASDDVQGAKSLLAHCDADNTDVVAANAACALAEGDCTTAAKLLSRAIDAEPSWPLHHWNLSVALHQLGDLPGSHQALQRFLVTSSAPSGLDADPDQAGRIARANGVLKLDGGSSPDNAIQINR